jgi:hypothetical protein
MLAFWGAREALTGVVKRVEVWGGRPRCAELLDFRLWRLSHSAGRRGNDAGANGQPDHSDQNQRRGERGGTREAESWHNTKGRRKAWVH